MLNKTLGVMAFVDVAIIVALPIGVILLARRGRPLWKSYAVVVLPYLLYGVGAGRLPYFTAYVLLFACMPLEAVHVLRCAGSPWQVWLGAFVILGMVPTALLFAIHALRRRDGRV